MVQSMGNWAESVGVNPGSAVFLLCNLGKCVECLCCRLLPGSVGTLRVPSPNRPKG